MSQLNDNYVIKQIIKAIEDNISLIIVRTERNSDAIFLRAPIIKYFHSFDSKLILNSKLKILNSQIIFITRYDYPIKSLGLRPDLIIDYYY